MEYFRTLRKSDPTNAVNKQALSKEAFRGHLKATSKTNAIPHKTVRQIRSQNFCRFMRKAPAGKDLLRTEQPVPDIL